MKTNMWFKRLLVSLIALTAMGASAQTLINIDNPGHDECVSASELNGDFSVSASARELSAGGPVTVTFAWSADEPATYIGPFDIVNRDEGYDVTETEFNTAFNTGYGNAVDAGGQPYSVNVPVFTDNIPDGALFVYVRLEDGGTTVYHGIKLNVHTQEGKLVDVTSTGGCASDTVEFTVNFDKEVSLTLADLLIDSTGVTHDVPVVAPGPGFANSYTVTFNNVSGAGKIDLGIKDPNSIADCAGNGLDATSFTPNGVEASVNVDAENPVANCKPFTLNLDASGNGTLNPSDIDNVSTDNVGIASYAVNGAATIAYTCADIGVQVVTLLVTDACGNTDTCDANVTVADNMKPTFTGCPSGDQNVVAAADCFYTVAGTGLNLASTDDNCGVASVLNDFTGTNTLDAAQFPVGTTAVVWTVTDVNGNTDTCSFNVVVTDETNPTIDCASVGNQTVDADGTCHYTVPDDSWNPSFSDNCAGVTITNDKTNTATLNSATFDLGDTTVIWTATDASGNTTACSYVVTVEDNTAPVINAIADKNVVMDNNKCYYEVVGTGWDATAPNDNCPGVVTITHDYDGGGTTLAGKQFTVGDTTVTWTLTDANGNTDDEAFVVTVTDDQLPTFDNCPAGPIVLSPNTGCNYLVGSPDANLGADVTGTDNCIVSIAHDQGGGDLTSLAGVTFAAGDTTVTWTLTDANGNTAACQYTVTVTDDVKPTVNCVSDQPVGTNGGLCSYTVAGAGWDPTFADIEDNCTPDGGLTVTHDQGGDTSTLAGAIFPIGDTVVTWTVADNAGNTGTCSFTVTVTDDDVPSPVCQPVTIQLDGNGNASLTAAQVDNGSTDNCTIPGNLTLSLSQTTFTCVDLGSGPGNIVTLTVEDEAGNTSTCTSQVTVEDNVKPTADCKNITISLGAGPGGNVSISASDLNGASSDNCTAANALIFTATQTDFTCADLAAPTLVTVTVQDASGNTDTCTATVTVEDTTKPTPACVAPFTVQLNGAGMASTTAAAVDNGSTDNDTCTPVGLAIDVASFDCTDVGTPVTVTLTVTDASGNTNTCTTVVTVEDSIDPVAACQDIVVQLDTNGAATITAADIDNGSSDNCGAPSLSVDITSFTCADILGGGPVAVTLTATDASGNTHECMANVTVEDNVKPVAMCKDIEVELDGTGNVMIAAIDVDNTSTDNCAVTGRTVSQTGFDCTDVGAPVTVTLEVTDASGNTDTCEAKVTVLDKLKPTATCQDIAVQLDATGNITIAAADVDNGSTDNCVAGIGLAIDKTAFTCADIGPQTVTLTVTDASGNTASCESTVTVEDNIAPVITACYSDVTKGSCGGGYTVQGTEFETGLAVTEVCDWTVTNNVTGTASLGGHEFAVGAHTVTWTVTDAGGNTDTCDQTVTISSTVITLTEDLITTPRRRACNFVKIDVTVDCDWQQLAFAVDVDQTKLRFVDLPAYIQWDDTTRIHHLATKGSVLDNGRMYFYIDNPAGDNSGVVNVKNSTDPLVSFYVQVLDGAGLGATDITVVPHAQFGIATTPQGVSTSFDTADETITIDSAFDRLDVNEDGQVDYTTDGVIIYRAVKYARLDGLIPIVPATQRTAYTKSEEEVIARVLVGNGMSGNAARLDLDSSIVGVDAPTDAVYLYRFLRAVQWNEGAGLFSATGGKTVYTDLDAADEAALIPALHLNRVPAPVADDIVANINTYWYENIGANGARSDTDLVFPAEFGVPDATKIVIEAADTFVIYYPEALYNGGTFFGASPALAGTDWTVNLSAAADLPALPGSAVAPVVVAGVTPAGARGIRVVLTTNEFAVDQRYDIDVQPSNTTDEIEDARGADVFTTGEKLFPNVLAPITF